mmetsp:Transcript_24821/g.36605  ORF Transcript_24821/g.36605 Transcript_24821/m.36605 type:complete len:231 (+) Transcript_24821:60-752(+)|eukprot:CAMPEP_0185019902 /NCGR_PEP_ID=MMETSP1103-20130426/2493_1 /TAXON_ID=36769 /ORGANISM="Paraphysomonas bandaiensis, Strain Caron Lab Isolate" /LENGTH=230 /DNA_ID=CAMNT_0027550463 /DNA_START=21 /DNA_END=713 /DNA_ORIENTATION=-
MSEEASNAVPSPAVDSPARLKFLSEVENALTGPDLVNAAKAYAEYEKGQAAFAFNRAKKVLVHTGVLDGEKWQRTYGSMGKMRADFYAAFNSVPPEIMEHLKNAMFFDSRVNKSYRSPNSLFPDRHGRNLEDVGVVKTSSSKKRKNRSKVVNAVQDPLAEVVDATGGNVTIATAGLDNLPEPVSAVELEERVRSIKSARLANALSHPSFSSLDEQSQGLIKQQWLSTLVE